MSQFNTTMDGKSEQTRKIVFVLGGPGSGKGTQVLTEFDRSHYMSEHFGFSVRNWWNRLISSISVPESC